MNASYKKDYPLKSILKIILKRLWIIILCTVICTAGSFLVSKYILEKQYTAAVSMYVTPIMKDMDAGDYLNYLSYSKEIVGTYTHILKTNSFLKSVSDASHLGYSAKALDKMIEVEVLDNTEIFRISVTTNSPEDSLKIADTAASLAPEKLMEMKTADSVSVVDAAVLPKEPNKPNIFLNTIIGFILGLGLGYLIVNILETFDNSIKDEDDFLENYDIPILGIIPKIKEE